MHPFLKRLKLNKIITWAKANKVIAGIVVVAILGAGYGAYAAFGGSAAAVTYVYGNVDRGDITTTIDATGQVSASNQLDIMPQVSGEVWSVNVTNGARVAQGQLLAVIDPTDAQKSVRDAAANLESAEISLEKLLKPASTLTLTQAQNALTNAEDSLTKLYADAKVDITDTFLDMPSIIAGLEEVLTDSTACGGSQANVDCYSNAVDIYDPRASSYRDQALVDFADAKKAYDTVFTKYQSLGAAPSDVAVEEVLATSFVAVGEVAQAVKSAHAFIQLYVDIRESRGQTVPTVATESLADLNTDTVTLNGHLSTLLADTSSFKTSKQSIIEKQQSLADVTDGADTLDVRSATLSITKARDSLADAERALAKYYVRAPFAGTIASLNIKKYDRAGSSKIATLITDAKTAELSLNEVDVAKVQVGDKAALTFDAVEDATLEGTVAEVDSIGTVTQGVVSYQIKIAFDTGEYTIRPSMTVNASIIVESKQGVLVVPASAVKEQNGESYVEAMREGRLTRVPVEVGITDDIRVEIVAGLNEGDEIVVRTTTGTAAETTTTAAPRVGGGGGGGGGGGPQFRGI
ncbi:MAG: efflux RND transporter periplasmic adaptor subunit [Patescibacteria group bacterium]